MEEEKRESYSTMWESGAILEAYDERKDSKQESKKGAQGQHNTYDNNICMWNLDLE